MDDEDRAFSDGDEGDLFESEAEDEGSDVEGSVDLSALSLASLEAAIAREAGGDGSVTSQASVVQADQSDKPECSEDSSFTRHQASDGDATDGEGEREEGETDGPQDFGGTIEQEGGQSEKDHDEGYGDDEGARDGGDTQELVTAPALASDSSNLSNGNHQGDDEEQRGARGEDCEEEEGVDDSNIVQEAHLDGEIRALGFNCSDLVVTPPLENDHYACSAISSPSNVEKPALRALDKMEWSPIEKRPGDEQIQALGSVDESMEDTRTTTEGKQCGAAVSPLPLAPDGIASIPLYTVASLFPVVYEGAFSSRESGSKLPEPVEPTSNRRSRRDQQKPSTVNSSVGPRLAALQSQLEATHGQLKSSTRAFKLQIAMADADNRKVTQRNGRLKAQLATATADLQRTKAELAKLKAENELYAAKLPRLQAELLEETSQVDETQAQSAQAQLILTQLKARAHVLQTRNTALEAQNDKLTRELREGRQQLRRKTALLQQQTEKTSKLEGEMNTLKTARMQAAVDWKSRMAGALQRSEHDKVKREAEWRHKERQELKDAKLRAEKANKKRRDAEARLLKVEEQLKRSNHEVTLANDSIQRQMKETHTLEMALRKAHRSEETLRNSLATCTAKVHALQIKNRELHVTNPASIQRRRRRLELLLPPSDSSEDEDNQEEQYCVCCLKSMDAHEVETIDGCKECPALQDQLRQARENLRRVRTLHSAELQAQALVLEAWLPQRANSSNSQKCSHHSFKCNPLE
ncbi:hypothetical protein BBJ28_00018690 [Nothophytophthora sp. Chile5]|nr:hypothetical protein BBJ28_00018690 [Nothophytophthora sp. Chile5]